MPYEKSLSENRAVFMRKDTEGAHFELALYGEHPEFKNMTFLHDHFSYRKNVLCMRKRYGTGSL